MRSSLKFNVVFVNQINTKHSFANSIVVTISKQEIEREFKFFFYLLWRHLKLTLNSLRINRKKRHINDYKGIIVPYTICKKIEPTNWCRGFFFVLCVVIGHFKIFSKVLCGLGFTWIKHYYQFGNQKKENHFFHCSVQPNVKNTLL